MKTRKTLAKTRKTDKLEIARGKKPKQHLAITNNNMTDRVTERAIDKNKEVETRHQEETRWTENGHIRRVEIDGKTPNLKAREPETTRTVKIKN